MPNFVESNIMLKFCLYGKYVKFILKDDTLKMETICFSETLVFTYKSTRRYYPEDQHRRLHRRENLKC
jgi:hypothetical protein